jgi:hypothetical protein
VDKIPQSNFESCRIGLDKRRVDRTDNKAHVDV